MRRNPVLERLRTGGVAVGTFAIELSSPALARVAATAGAEFIALDQEHSGFGSETVRSFLAGARAADIVPLIRVASKHAEPLSLALDLGALGVIVPFIESAEEAAAAVSSLKYPPIGRRGFGLLHLDEHDGDVGRYMAEANDRTMVVVQIESRSGLEDVERIASGRGARSGRVGMPNRREGGGDGGGDANRCRASARSRVLLYLVRSRPHPLPARPCGGCGRGTRSTRDPAMTFHS